MKPRRSAPEIPITVPPIEDYTASILETNPALGQIERAAVIRLATLYRMLDYHGKVLNADPGDEYSGDAYQKLAALALRHEDALGIVGKRESGKPSPVAPIRPKEGTAI